MKTVKTYLKTVTFALSFLILLQGCIVYKSTPVSLEEASKMNKPVRVITKNDEKVKYDRIIEEDGNYYTVKKEKKAIVIIPIDTKQIKEVKVKDELASKLIGIGVLVAVIGLFVGAIFAPTFNGGGMHLSY